MTAAYLAIALVALAAAAWAVTRLMPARSTAASATAELADLEREEYVLRKNMLHDRHRLAFIGARRKHLGAYLPASLEASKPSTVVRWLGRAAPAVEHEGPPRLGRSA